MSVLDQIITACASSFPLLGKASFPRVTTGQKLLVLVSHLSLMNMHAAPVSQWRCRARIRSYDHSVFEKVTGRSVVGRLIKNGPEAPLSVFKYLKNGATTRS